MLVLLPLDPRDVPLLLGDVGEPDAGVGQGKGHSQCSENPEQDSEHC